MLTPRHNRWHFHRRQTGHRQGDIAIVTAGAGAHDALEQFIRHSLIAHNDYLTAKTLFFRSGAGRTCGLVVQFHAEFGDLYIRRVDPLSEDVDHWIEELKGL